MSGPEGVQDGEVQSIIARRDPQARTVIHETDATSLESAKRSGQAQVCGVLSRECIPSANTCQQVANEAPNEGKQHEERQECNELHIRKMSQIT